MLLPSCWIQIVLLLAVASSAAAQRQPPAATPERPALITSLAGQARPMLPELLPAPRPLTPAAQLTMAQSVGGLNVSGIGRKLRLTPAAPSSAERGYLILKHAHTVNTDGQHAAIILHATDGMASVAFRPTVANQPILVDFWVNVQPPSGKRAPILIAGEKRELNAGPQHVTAIVVPKDTAWYHIAIYLPTDLARVYVYAVELTLLQ